MRTKCFFMSITCLMVSQSCFTMNTEYTPLIDNTELNEVIVEHTRGLKEAYNKGLKTKKNGSLLTGRFLGITSCEPTLSTQKLFNFTLLTQIDLSHNKLAIIPDNLLSSTHNLKELNLSHNDIAHIPTGIPAHTNLKVLCLHSNKLITCPLESLLCILPNLEQLTLHNNQITNYGDINLQHTSLQELWIDNTISHASKKIIATQCPSLTAEICENDQSVQNLYTVKKIHIEKCTETYSLASIASIGIGQIITPIIFSIWIYACYKKENDIACTTLDDIFQKLHALNDINSNDHPFLYYAIPFGILSLIGSAACLAISPIIVTCYCLRHYDQHTESIVSKKIATHPLIKLKT